MTTLPQFMVVLIVDDSGPGIPAAEITPIGNVTSTQAIGCTLG